MQSLSVIGKWLVTAIVKEAVFQYNEAFPGIQLILDELNKQKIVLEINPNS